MPEIHQPKEQLETIKSVEHNVEHANIKHERELSASEKAHGNEDQIEQLSKDAEQKAISGKERSTGESEQTQNHPVMVNKQLKNVAFSRALTRARKKLPLPSKTFSRIVHVNAIDRSSEFIGKTVARPTSMLSGAFFSFVGTSALLWATRRYGYDYNYLIIVLLFIGGWIVGLVFDGIKRSLKKSN